MYVNVRLLNGYPQTLTYKIPSDWQTHGLVGTIIRVPLQKRTESALVTRFFDTLPPNISYTIREAVEKERVPEDPKYHSFIQQLSRYYALDPMSLYRRVRLFLTQKEKTDEPLLLSNQHLSQVITLTDEQQAIVDFIAPHITQPAYTPTLLHGVTGSGKTEVYKRVIQQAHALGKSTLFIVPEVSLAVRFTHVLKQELNGIPVHGFHSASGAQEKKELWQQLTQEAPVVIVGVHLPALLPLGNLGLIVVDEEHDAGFQEKKHPKINTKEALLIRAQHYSIPIILGSATPSMQSLYNVRKNNWDYFTIKKRFAGAFPTVTMVRIDGKVARKNFWITRELEKAIENRLQKKEQSIIFLNRRGYSFFVQCKACAFVFECPSCSVSLTLHSDNTLRCHYCTRTRTQPTTCPGCRSTKNTLIKKGIGTQQVVTILQTMFPQARIERADMDSTVNKKKWQTIVTKMHNRELDILVGTQTITKGYHFPNVTLVGLLWADINLHIPFYNAAETALQQIIQVAGRAGRQSNESLVIAQTMGDHPIFNYINEQDYTKFYEYEIGHRQELNYPPCARFAELELRSEDETVVDKESNFCVDILENYSKPLKILGPAQPPIHKIKNVFIRKIYLKSSSYQTIHAAYQELLKTKLTSKLFFTPNPQQ